MTGEIERLTQLHGDLGVAIAALKAAAPAPEPVPVPTPALVVKRAMNAAELVAAETADIIEVAAPVTLTSTAPGIDPRKAIEVRGVVPGASIVAPAGHRLYGNKAAIAFEFAALAVPSFGIVRDLALAGMHASDNAGAGIFTDGKVDLVCEGATFDAVDTAIRGNARSWTVRGHKVKSWRGTPTPASDGYQHAFYAGAMNSALFEDGETAGGANDGHIYKSRAKATTVRRCKHDDGAAAEVSQFVDCPNGGDLIVEDCVIRRTYNGGNHTLIRIGEEGATNPTSRITIRRNTVILVGWPADKAPPWFQEANLPASVIREIEQPTWIREAAPAPAPMPTPEPTPTPTPVPGATNGAWELVPDTIATRIFPPKRTDFWGISGPTDAWVAWNGAATDTDAGAMYLAANGGHAGYGGNEVYSFDLEAKAIARLTDPAVVIPDPARPGGFLIADGKSPISRHTYSSAVWIESLKRVAIVGGVPFSSGGVGPDRTLWLVDPATKLWEAGPLVPATTGNFVWSVVTPTELIHGGQFGRLCRLTLATHAWQPQGVGSHLIPQASVAAYGGGQTLALIHDYTSSTGASSLIRITTSGALDGKFSMAKVATIGDPLPGWAGVAGIAYRDVDACFYINGGGVNVWKLNPVSMAVTKLAPTLPAEGWPAAVVKSNGLYNKWGYSRKHDAFIMWRVAEEPVRIFRP